MKITDHLDLLAVFVLALALIVCYAITKDQLLGNMMSWCVAGLVGMATGRGVQAVRRTNIGTVEKATVMTDDPDQTPRA